MRLFISYSHEDKWQVKQLVDTLREGGYEPWFDHALVPGQNWKTQLLQAIASCTSFVYAMTPESVKSEWCLWELEQAVKMNKPVIPVLMQRTVTLPEKIKDIQYVDFSEGPTTSGVAKLMYGLRTATPISPTNIPKAPQNPQGIPSQAFIPSQVPEIQNFGREIPLKSAPKPPVVIAPGPNTVLRDTPFERPISAAPVTTLSSPSNPVQITSKPQVDLFQPAVRQFQLLYQTLIAPKKLQENISIDSTRYSNRRYTFDDEIRPAFGWLVSTLIWLPLVLLTLGYVFSIVPVPFNFLIQIIVLILFITMWFTTGYWSINEELNGGMISGIIVFLGSSLLTGHLINGAAINLGYDTPNLVSRLMPLIFVLTFALAVTVTIAAQIATNLNKSQESVALFTSVGVILGYLAGIGIGFLVVVWNAQIDIIPKLIIIVVWIILFLLITGILGYGLWLLVDSVWTTHFAEKLESSFGGTFTFALLTLSSVALVWLYILGGWHVLVA